MHTPPAGPEVLLGGVEIEEPTSDQPILVGKTPLHRSHKLAFFPSLELWACLTCGSYAETLARDLGKPCSNVRSRRGQDNIKALEVGRHPKVPARRQAETEGPLFWPVAPKSASSAGEG